jgi:hypothetical protein
MSRPIWPIATGLESSRGDPRAGHPSRTDLIAFALANVALEDEFAEAFKDVRGKVDARLKLGF